MSTDLPPARPARNIRQTWGALALFLLCALMAVLPVLPDFSGRIIGNIDHPGLRGEMFHQWDFARNAAAGHLADYYYSRGIACPSGSDLRPFIGFSLHLFFYLPFLWLSSLVARYNLLLILTMALNGFSAFLLGRHLSRSFPGGLVCGLLFLLSPYALLKIEMGFLQKAILWWIPLFVLFLLRFLEGKRGRDALLAGLCWSGMALTYAPYAWLSLMGAAILAPGVIGARKAAWRGVLAAGWPFLVPAVLTVLFLASHLPAGGFRHEYLPYAIRTAPNGSLDLLHLFRFHPYHGFFPQVDNLPLAVSLAGSVLAVAAVLLRLPGAAPLFLMGIFFLVLSLGPYLQSEGRIISSFPLPYYFFSMYIPWGERVGFSIRVLPFVEVALCALSALVIGRVADGGARPARRRAAAFLALALAALALAERQALLPELFPPPVTDTALAPELRWLGSQRNSVVLHLPYNVRGDEPHAYCYLSARSDTRMMNRYIGVWRDFPVPPFPAPSAPVMAAYLERLAEQGCDLIVVHPGLLASRRHPLAAENAGDIESYSLADTEVLRDWCGPPAYSGGTNAFVAYRVPRPAVIRKIAGAQAASPGEALSSPALIREAYSRGLWQRADIAGKVRSFEERLVADALLEDEVFKRIAFSDEDLRSYYESHQAEFARPVQIRVHHVLVRVPPAATGEQKRAADVKAKELLARMQAGVASSFALISELTKDDPQGLRWGDIGYFSRGTFDPAIEARLFGMRRVGECALIEGQDGLHVFRLMDIRPGRTPAFAEVREGVRNAAMQDARRRAARDYALKVAQAAPRTADDMVFVPGGSFWLGSTEAEIDRAANMARRFVGRTREVRREWFEDETYRLARVRPFYMDRCEVTVGDYKQFLAAMGYQPLPEWVSAIATNDRMPVVGVSWEDAGAYARWQHKRLPTAEEWEWAARGAARRWFPWGDAAPDGSRANYADARTSLLWNDPLNDDGHAQLACAGSYPAGATPEGILDLGGNAREWTATGRSGIIDSRDRHIWTYEQRAQVPAACRSGPMLMYCVRGGSWSSAADDLRCSDERMLPPDTRVDSLGFRCVRDADPSAEFRAGARRAPGSVNETADTHEE